MIETLTVFAKIMTIRTLRFVRLTGLADKLNAYWSRP